MEWILQGQSRRSSEIDHLHWCSVAESKPRVKLKMYYLLVGLKLESSLVAQGFPGGSDGKKKKKKKSTRKAGDLGSIPGLGRFPGGRHGNPLQYSCLESPMDRGAWWAVVHGAAKSQA